MPAAAGDGGRSGPRNATVRAGAESLPADQVGPLLKALTDASIAYVSFGEDHELVEFHDTVLELLDDGGHSVAPARPTEAAERG